MVDGSVVTPQLAPSSWIAVNVHILKEQMMQRVLRGGILAQFHGNVKNIDPDDGSKAASYSVIQVHDAFDKWLSVRNHVCVVLSKERATNASILASSTGSGMRCSGILEERLVMTAAMLEYAEFKLSLLDCLDACFTKKASERTVLFVR